MNVVSAKLRLSAQRALLGAIHPELRLVKVKLVGSTIHMTSIAERKLSDAATEALSIAASEIIADFPEVDLITESVIVANGELP